MKRKRKKKIQLLTPNKPAAQADRHERLLRAIQRLEIEWAQQGLQPDTHVRRGRGRDRRRRRRPRAAAVSSRALPVRLPAVATAANSERVRLAELVAALSLGIDLGFGQPMEHVLRQCLIALRLAERLGLDDEERAVVYYTALLVNVGCHTDAHEQAKWFGDDIALKADKYDYELRSIRMMASGMRRHRCRQPAAAPLPDRPRVPALGSPRGGRHDRPARRDGARAR